MKIFLFKFILSFTAALPLKLIHLLGKGIGKLSWISNSRIRRIAEKNIQLCFPELNNQQQTEMVRKILNETGKVILEAGKMWHSNADTTLKLVQECENVQLIKQAQRQGRGVIIAMPHYGSWEVLNLYCARHYPVTSMYAPQENSQADQLIRQARQRSGATLVPTDTSGIRAMSKALKQAELVLMLPDQSPKDAGQFAEFFGHPCYTMTLLPKLAKKTNAVVLYAYAKRLENSSGFKLIFRPSSKDLATLELGDALVQMNLDIEKLIRETPHQYQWTYKRFKKQPEGSKNIY